VLGTILKQLPYLYTILLIVVMFCLETLIAFNLKALL
jgi:hypothetical protein